MITPRESNISWVRGVFGPTITYINRRATQLKPRSSAELKFADTTLGGNAAINSPPQFTRFADPARTGLFASSSSNTENGATSVWANENNHGSYKLGRYYSEKHDDTAQYVHLRFGVPKYTGSIAFFANNYDRDAAILARTGEYSSALRTAGTIAGFAAITALVPLPVFIPLLVVGQVLKFVTGMKPSKYYYLKPTMNTYLQAVQAMLDTQLLYYRLVPMWDVIGTDRYIDIENDKNRLKESMDDVYSALPDIWKSNGKFDVYKMINRFQILANYQKRELEALYDKSNSPEELNAALESYVEMARTQEFLKNAVTDEMLNLQGLVKAYTENPLYQVSTADAAEQAAIWDKVTEGSMTGGITAEDIVNEQNLGSSAIAPDDQKNQTKGSFWNGLTNFFSDSAEQLQSELNDGGQWITFKVDGKQTVSDSFNNTTGDPEIKTKVNSLTASARSVSISASEGKTGFDFVDSAISSVKNFIGGAVDTLHLTGLAAVYGSSFTDIPEVWEASSATVGSQSITIPLRSPFGDDLSLFQNITVPLMFIVASVAALATGKQTYTSPFLCEMYCRGRQNIRLGMVDSVSITRGVGNKGWREDGKMLGCDVTINIKDLSKVVAMNIISDPGMFDDDNMFTDYMATLGGASLQDMTYATQQLTFNLNRWKQSWKSAFMSGRITNSIASTAPMRFLSGFTVGTAL